MSCFVLFSLLAYYMYLNVSFIRLITSVGEPERAASPGVLLFLFEGVSLPLGAKERLRYFIVTLSMPST